MILKKIFAMAPVVLLVAILSGLMVTPALGQQPERAKVLIGFRTRPGPAEEALVRRMAGTVDYAFHLVPAIAATVPETAIANLRANAHVIRVERDAQAYAVEIELDNSWGVSKIGAGEVHTAGNIGEDISIAIIDSGVDRYHPDLFANYVGGKDFVDPDTEPLDVYGHGTHVAGTACAENNDNGVDDATGKFGVVGVAPGCDLYSLRVLDDEGFGYASEIIAAMQWAVTNKLQVANLSLGWDRDPGEIVKTAFDNAWDAGLVVVAAAGNSGNPPGRGSNVIYPAKYDSVIAVAATDDEGKRASFSSTGDEVELAAPGVSVFSTWNDHNSYSDPQPVCREDLEDCYKYGSGTSMASPHVAGTAALILASGIADTNDEVRQRLQTTADDLGDAGRDPQYGYGLVDADEAAPTVGNPPTVSWANPGDNDIVIGTVTVQVDAWDAEDDMGSLTVEWQVVGGGWRAATHNPDTGYYEDTWNSTGESDGDHLLGTQATDSDSNATSSSITVTTENIDDPPIVSWVTPDGGDTVKDTVTIQIDASDDQDIGSDLTVEWRVDDDTWETASYDAVCDCYTDDWDTTSVSDGDHNLVAQVTDTAAQAATDSVSVTVDNEASATVEVYSIYPFAMEAGSEIDVTITGTGFVDGADVTFENGLGPAPTASNVVVVDEANIGATVTTKSVGPPLDREWDVRVTNPGGSSAVLDGGFTVTR